jgi:hypothetical protein
MARVRHGKVVGIHPQKLKNEWVFYPQQLPQRWRREARRIGNTMPQVCLDDEERENRAVMFACLMLAEVAQLPTEEMRQDFVRVIPNWYDALVPAMIESNKSGVTPSEVDINARSIGQPFEKTAEAALGLTLDATLGPTLEDKLRGKKRAS